jgi:hypothetical protein
MTYLKKAWAIWKKFGHFMGDIVGRVVLSLLYFTLVMPFGIGTRLFSDPLQIKPPTQSSFWNVREAKPDSMEEAQRQ